MPKTNECSLGSLVAAVQKQSLMAAVSPCKACSMYFYVPNFLLIPLHLSIESMGGWNVYVGSQQPPLKKKHSCSAAHSPGKCQGGQILITRGFNLKKKWHWSSYPWKFLNFLYFLGEKTPRNPSYFVGYIWATGFWHVLTKPYSRINWDGSSWGLNNHQESYTIHTPSGYLT